MNNIWKVWHISHQRLTSIRNRLQWGPIAKRDYLAVLEELNQLWPQIPTNVITPHSTPKVVNASSINKIGCWKKIKPDAFTWRSVVKGSFRGPHVLARRRRVSGETQPIGALVAGRIRFPTHLFSLGFSQNKRKRLVLRRSHKPSIPVPFGSVSRKIDI